ncbi:DUF2471 domain-containing protein [Caballeronia grimmiae]|uniref:DUF2471 domain-containing protein n=1 Tax=Caballeronia grimmiae TaxID=1071679 RepID=UPI0038BBB57C
MDAMIALDTAIRDALPDTVARYRSASVLTRALLHEIEADLLKQLAITGHHSKWVPELIRTTPLFDDPNDEGPAIEEYGKASMVCQAIEQAWRRAEDEDMRCRRIA